MRNRAPRIEEPQKKIVLFSYPTLRLSKRCSSSKVRPLPWRRGSRHVQQIPPTLVVSRQRLTCSPESRLRVSLGSDLACAGLRSGGRASLSRRKRKRLSSGVRMGCTGDRQARKRYCDQTLNGKGGKKKPRVMVSEALHWTLSGTRTRGGSGALVHTGVEPAQDFGKATRYPLQAPIDQKRSGFAQ